MPSGAEISPAPQEEGDMADRNAAARRSELGGVAGIRVQLSALGAMTVGELAERYHELFGTPTRSRNKAYLRRHIAWRLQERSEGGLSLRALERIELLAREAPARWQAVRPEAARSGADAPKEPPPVRDSRLPPAGAVLTRVYGGVEHRVTVLVDGFEFRGKRHRSLSSIARVITGTSWNGFAFFLGRARGDHNDTTKARS